MRIEEFWQDFLKINKMNPNQEYSDVFHFETNEKAANELLELVLIGKKTATSSCLKSYDTIGIDIPKVGDHSIITDWDGEPHVVIKTTSIKILPFSKIDFDLAKLEGEDENLESWQESHKKFFSEEGKALGFQFSDDIEVVFEEFIVLYKK